MFRTRLTHLPRSSMQFRGRDGAIGSKCPSANYITPSAMSFSQALLYSMAASRAFSHLSSHISTYSSIHLYSLKLTSSAMYSYSYQVITRSEWSGYYSHSRRTLSFRVVSTPGSASLLALALVLVRSLALSRPMFSPQFLSR